MSDLATRVDQYIQVRAKRSALKREWVQQDEKLAELEVKISAILMEHLQTTGVKSARTDKGTFYLYDRGCATVADGDAFMQYVTANSAFELLERRANSTAVKTYIQKHQSTPPGVNYNVETKVGITKPRTRKLTEEGETENGSEHNDTEQ